MKPTPPGRSSYKRAYRNKGRRYLRSGGRRARATYTKRAIPFAKKNIVGSYFGKIPQKVYSQTWNVCLSAVTKLTDKYADEWKNKGIDPANPNLIPTTWGIDFRLKDALNANTHYGLMFNRYKINAVKLTMIPRGSRYINTPMVHEGSELKVDNQDEQYSFVYLFVDPNDYTKPSGANEAEVEDYFKRQKNVIKRRCDKTITVMFQPKILNVVYQRERTDGQDQGIDFGFTSAKAPWIEINELPSPAETIIPSLDFSHLGLKGMITNSSPNWRWRYDITLEYYVSFNGIRR